MPLTLIAASDKPPWAPTSATDASGTKLDVDDSGEARSDQELSIPETLKGFETSIGMAAYMTRVLMYAGLIQPLEDRKTQLFAGIDPSFRSG
ncbi:hypothetical protein DL765_011359 [Monosporascus sp. GIB2]|nr:hypothetical protein DL765_011359 [Monosporascus sp. GIB2]